MISRARPPVISPQSGSYRAPLTVTIVSDTPGAEIYITRDGRIPTQRSERYAGPIEVRDSSTIAARAFKSGLEESFTNSMEYQITGGDNPTPAPTPTPPGPSDIRFEVDAKNTFEISPFIYGVNLYPPSGAIHSFATLFRLGGNNWTPYNWKNNATNAGSDHSHYNSAFLGGGETAGAAVTQRVDKIRAAKAQALIQIPMSDYVAADKLDGDVKDTPDYLNKRFRRNFPWFWQGADATQVYQNEFLAHLAERFGYGSLFLELDNEPDLWDDTHPRIFQKPTYASYIAKAKEYAFLAREAGGSAAKIFAPSVATYNGIRNLDKAADSNGRHFIDFFLAEMRKESEAKGKRLLDVLDVHWYPQHTGSNGVVTCADNSDSVTARARVEAPRSLWDPTFQEKSWITNETRKPINLIPDLRARIAAHYPGTALSFTEYYYGGGDHISGGIAQADVLGIFGREGIFAANLWPLGHTQFKFTHAAFRCFRDYDGKGGRLGDTGAKATTSDPTMSSIYSATNGVNILINKHEQSKKAVITFKENPTEKSAETYVLSGANAVVQKGPAVKAATPGVYYYEMPAMSVTVFVI